MVEKRLSPLSSNDSVATIPHMPEQEPNTVEPTRRRGWEAYAHLYDQPNQQTRFFASANLSSTLNNNNVSRLRQSFERNGYGLRNNHGEECVFAKKINTDTFPTVEKLQLLLSIYAKENAYIPKLFELMFNYEPDYTERRVEPN